MKAMQRVTGPAVIRVIAGILALGLAVGACGGRQTPEAPSNGGGGDGAPANGCETGSGRMTIATGNSTGVYYVLGGGLAKLISDETNLQATAAETSSGTQRVQFRRVERGGLDLIFFFSY